MGIACLIPHSFVHSTGEPKTSTSQILASTRITRGTCHSVLGPTPGVPDSVGLRWGLSIYMEWFCCWKIKFKNKSDEMLGSATGMWLGNLSFKNTRIQTQSPHTYSESDTIVTYLALIKVSWLDSANQNEEFLHLRRGSFITNQLFIRFFNLASGYLEPNHFVPYVTLQTSCQQRIFTVF